LIHISELSDHRVDHPKEVLKVGDVVTLRILKIEDEDHRIGLSMRRVDSPAYADSDWKSLAADFDLTPSTEGETLATILGEATPEPVEEAKEVVEDVFAEAPEAVAETVEEAKEVVEDAVAEAPEAVAETVEEAKEVVEDVVAEAPEAVAETVEKAKEVVEETAEAVEPEADEEVKED